MITINNFVKVKTLAEAYQLNQKRTNVVIGGFMWLKMGNRKIQNAIDLSGLGLNKIEETDDEFRIGSMCTLRDLELHEGLNNECQGALKEAVYHIVGVQFRNGATVGGSIYGRYGFSDVLTCLMVLDCYVELFKGGIISLKEFAKKKYDNDILVRILIKKDSRKVSYQSQRNAKMDFPLIAVAVAKKKNNIFVAVGARPMKAKLIQKSGCLSEQNPSQEEIAEFADWAKGQFSYGSNMRASKEYREYLAYVYIKRGVKEVLKDDH
ncbi:molybdopterin dehydrogenase [Acetobacterium paludosum]|uniref:Molybdopterin dehydrogenase n=1 Tax=Acetobacterium paludosum TaxID=52693 RepID=A0A923KV50_9FIRM|nr:FAD binding domain-containing protein [Acetobacterium paludosum]MBC3887135.1 molybdopterin dehydrogenase [Acetobacterium paludosum]